MWIHREKWHFSSLSASFGCVVLNFSLAKLHRFISSQLPISFVVGDNWLAEEAFGKRDLFFPKTGHYFLKRGQCIPKQDIPKSGQNIINANLGGNFPKTRNHHTHHIQKTISCPKNTGFEEDITWREFLYGRG